MNNSDNFRKLIEKSLDESPADETEILAFRTDNSLTRVANSQIHQNVAEKNSAISVRAVIDNQIGVAATNRPDPEAVARTVEKAAAHARVAPRINDWPGLPRAEAISYRDISEDTESCTPGRRAELIREALKAGRNNRLDVAGALETGTTTFYIGNTVGGICRSDTSSVDLNAVLMSLDSSGYAAWVGRDINDLDVSKLVEAAAVKALSSRKPRSIDKGAYTVILEPPAVADMMGFLAYVGLGALAVQEKRSFMNGKFGKKLLDKKITLWDDANDPRTLRNPFDYEGVKKRKVVFFDKGVANEVVFDSQTAAREGKESTGHALPAPNSYGPLPLNLFLAEGESSPEEMIAGTERGVLVSRFHYTNIEEPMRAVLTGMTRDGTFLIDHGETVCGLHNLRFTQSILEAFSQVVAVGKERKLVDSFLGACYCPPLMIENFNFTGISD